MGDFYVDEEEVRQGLNVAERVLASLSAEDEYQAAMLMNQRLMAKVLTGAFSGGVNESLNLNDVNKDQLPLGLTGTSVQGIDNQDTGKAVFNIGGSSFQTRVKADGNISKNESIVIIDEGNVVRPAPDTQDTLNVIKRGQPSGENQRYWVTEEAITADSLEEKEEAWGFESDSIAIYDLDNPVQVAFNDPENTDRLIYLKPKTMPFTIDLSATSVRYRLRDEGDSPASFRVVAFK